MRSTSEYVSGLYVDQRERKTITNIDEAITAGRLDVIERIREMAAEAEEYAIGMDAARALRVAADQLETEIRKAGES